MRLFRRQGYATTGLQQILSESRVPKGSLYHHFPGGKEALGEAAVAMAGRLVAEMLTELAARHPADPEAFLDAYCRTMAGWMEESDFSSGCPIATTVLETVPQSGSIRDAATRAFGSWIEIIARVLEGAGEPRRESRRRAEAIIAAVEGALILARVHKSTRPILAIKSVLTN